MRSARCSLRALIAPSAVLLLYMALPPATADEKLNPRRMFIPRDRPPVLVPENLSDDLTVWPNRISFRNSDDWLWQNHATIRRMRPRVLVLNFANAFDMAAIRRVTDRFIRAIAESTRYHGFKDAGAPAFLTYEVVKYVDLRDSPTREDRARPNSTHFPYKPGVTEGQNCDYSLFYSDELAQYFGFQAPDGSGRYLNLTELIHSGIVHELWFYGLSDARAAPLGTIEYKQYYDEQCHPIEGRCGPGSDAHDDSMPWSGRSFRITFCDVRRELGCSLENLGHALEGMAHNNAIAYFRPYFYEFAGFDLDTRYGLPWKSLGEALATKGGTIEYPDPTTLVLRVAAREYVVRDYVAVGGNVSFPPGARRPSNLDNLAPVQSVIEDYRLRNGPGGDDLSLEFEPARMKKYADLAPGCLGAWVVYWRQCMPGLNNKAVDNDGKRMKNWWVFLFY